MIGSIFLLPNATWLVEVAVVLVILVVMTKKVLPMLNTAIEARQDKIRTALESAEKARLAAAAADDERERVLTEARDQARTIVTAAQEMSDQVKAESAGRGQAEYDRIVANAHNEVAAARKRAIDEASAKIGDVAFELVSKIVGREVDQAAHQDLVREAVAALQEASK